MEIKLQQNYEGHFENLQEIMINILKVLFKQERLLEKENIYFESFMNTVYSSKKQLVQKYLQYSQNNSKKQQEQQEQQQNIVQLEDTLENALQKAQMTFDQQQFLEEEEKKEQQKKEKILKPTLKDIEQKKKEEREKNRKSLMGPSRYQLEQQQLHEKKKQEQEQNQNKFKKPGLPKANLKNPNQIMGIGGNRKNTSSAMGQALGSSSTSFKRSSSTRQSTQQSSHQKQLDRIVQNKQNAQNKLPNINSSQPQNQQQGNMRRMNSQDKMKEINQMKQNIQNLQQQKQTIQSQKQPQYQNQHSQKKDIPSQQQQQQHENIDSYAEIHESLETGQKESQIILFKNKDNQQIDMQDKGNQVNQDQVEWYYDQKKRLTRNKKKYMESIKYFKEKEQKSKNNFLQKLQAHVEQKKIVQQKFINQQESSDQEEGENDDGKNINEQKIKRQIVLLFDENENNEVIQEMYNLENTGIQQTQMFQSYYIAFQSQIQQQNILKLLEKVVKVYEDIYQRGNGQQQHSKTVQLLYDKLIYEEQISSLDLFKIWYFKSNYIENFTKYQKEIEKVQENLSQYQQNFISFMKQFFYFKKTTESPESQIPQDLHSQIKSTGSNNSNNKISLEKNAVQEMQYQLSQNLVFHMNINNEDMKKNQVYDTDKQCGIKNQINLFKTKTQLFNILRNLSTKILALKMNEIMNGDKKIDMEEFKQVIKQLMILKSIVNFEGRIIPTVYFKKMISEYKENQDNSNDL